MTGGAKTPVTRPVDLGLPSGTLWAPANILATSRNGFAKSPYMYDASFVSFGNVDCHEATSPSSFAPWSWGAADTDPYISSPGATIITSDPVGDEYDAARQLCGYPWRLPTSAEWIELGENCDFIDLSGNVITDDISIDKHIVVPAYGGGGSVVGVMLRSRINGARLFLPWCGYGAADRLYSRATLGVYWSAQIYNAARAYCLRISNDTNRFDATFTRFSGLPIRPVMSRP